MKSSTAQNMPSSVVPAKGTIIFGDKTYKLATMNRRLMASVFDMFIITLVLSPILNLFNPLIYKEQSPQKILEDYTTTIGGESTIGFFQFLTGFTEYLSQQGIMIRYLIAQLVALVVLGIFIVAFWRLKGASIGKMIARCKIVDATTGKNPTLHQSILRFIGYIISSIPLGLGFIMISFTKKHQALHDKIANTVVVIIPWKSK